MTLYVIRKATVRVNDIQDTTEEILLSALLHILHIPHTSPRQAGIGTN